MDYQDNITLLQQAIGDSGVWSAKNRVNSELYKLIYVLSITHNEVVKELDAQVESLNVYKATIKNIKDWEYYAGIPDSVFTKTDELELTERIKQVIFKLIGFKNMTLTNLRNSLFNIFGFKNINIKRGKEVSGFPYTFPIIFIDQALVDNYLIIELPKILKTISGFPYTFPITFEIDKSKVIEEFIKAVVSFNIQLEFKYIL